MRSSLLLGCLGTTGTGSYLRLGCTSRGCGGGGRWRCGLSWWYCLGTVDSRCASLYLFLGCGHVVSKFEKGYAFEQGRALCPPHMPCPRARTIPVGAVPLFPIHRPVSSRFHIIPFPALSEYHNAHSLLVVIFSSYVILDSLASFRLFPSMNASSSNRIAARTLRRSFVLLLTKN